jgi:hypothetical protein
MASLCQRLRVIAATWLIIHAAWLTTLVAHDCCGPHRPSQRSCHQSQAVAHCPMQAAGGRPCAVHASATGVSAGSAQAAGKHDHQRMPAPVDCRLSGMCDGPAAGLFALLSNHAVLPAPTDALTVIETSALPPLALERVCGHYVPPDPPPPRA